MMSRAIVGEQEQSGIDGKSDDQGNNGEDKPKKAESKEEGKPKMYLRQCHLDRKEWMGDAKKSDIIKERFHPMAPGWSDALAMDLICRTYVKKKREGWNENLKCVTLDDVKDFWIKNNPHGLIETHLPADSPLDYAELIVIGKPTDESERKFIEDHVNGKCKVKFAASRVEARNIVFKYLNTKLPTEAPRFFGPVPTDEEGAKPATEETLERPHDNASHVGFTFTLTSTVLRELFIPVALNKDEMYIYFVASGRDFYLSLSNIGNTRSSEVERKSITFWMGNDKDVNVYKDSPLEAKLHQGACYPSFNNSAVFSKCVFYVVHVSRAKKMVTLSHWGPSRVFSDAEISVPFQQGADKKDVVYKYFSFSIGENEDRSVFPKIANVFVTEKNPPKVEYIPPPQRC